MDNSWVKHYQKRWVVCFGPERKRKMVGFERSTIPIQGKKYMDRWIVYLGWFNLRLHKFYRGDDDRASHTHPWWFITFPLSSYVEAVYERGRLIGTRVVKAWRPHFRPASFEHIVYGAHSGLTLNGLPLVFDGGRQKPFWTFVIAGDRMNSWGFYPEPDHFIYWRDYK